MNQYQKRNGKNDLVKSHRDLWVTYSATSVDGSMFKPVVPNRSKVRNDCKSEKIERVLIECWTIDRLSTLLTAITLFSPQNSFTWFHSKLEIFFVHKITGTYHNFFARKKYNEWFTIHFYIVTWHIFLQKETYSNEGQGKSKMQEKLSFGTCLTYP